MNTNVKLYLTMPNLANGGRVGKGAHRGRAKVRTFYLGSGQQQELCLVHKM